MNIEYNFLDFYAWESNNGVGMGKMLFSQFELLNRAGVASGFYIIGSEMIKVKWKMGEKSFQEV